MGLLLLVFLVFLVFIPVLGGLVKAGLMLIAIGSTIRVKYRLIASLRAKKLI